MTPTDELRRMLTEAGVEWTKPKRIWWELIDCEPDDSVTIVNDVTIEAATDGTLVVYPLTPEQAIAATICDTDATPTRQGDADLAAENAKLRVFASCAYGIASEFIRLNGCPYYDNGMKCSLSDECEEKDCAEQPDCLLDVLAKALGFEVGA